MAQAPYQNAIPALTELNRLEQELTRLRTNINELTEQVRELIGRATVQIAILAQDDIPLVVATPIQDARELRTGDRVRITNNIQQVRGRQIQERDRLATVRRVTLLRRVYITTDSGIETWRSADNLTHSPRVENVNRRDNRVQNNTDFIENGNI